MNEITLQRDPLEELAAEFTERCRRGEQPSVDAYAAQHPELADDIRDLFSMIRDVEQAKDAISGSGEFRAGEVPAVERLGDFRIIHELGRGGMGVVYEAEQESLGRRVAIKVLPHHYLASPTRRERFEREARTAAKLHHTNIVPIFGVGEHGGYPYFVMQCIRGVGLEAVFRKLFVKSTRGGESASTFSSHGSGLFDFGSFARGMLDTSPPGTNDGNGLQSPLSNPYWRGLSQLIAQAADALAYAHAQGVLHRDIKPSNLLLDSDGTLWVTDFGLAKGAEHEDITHAGDIVGTLRYMAPEQFTHQCDARSDVYSLGVTLYELAILRPAFADSERSSNVRAVLQESLYPARRLCPSLPRDLETIIEKSTAREPAHRYASAAAFADDLRRFVEDRPIHARPISYSERLWRWSRRNPALATSIGVALALLLTVAMVSSAAFLHVRQANLRTREALIGETRQRERAQSTADLAVEALETTFNEFAPEGPAVSSEIKLGDSAGSAISVSVPPVLSEDTARMLKRILEVYRRLAEQQSESRPLQLKIAAAQRRVGEIQERLGQNEDAKSAYETSIGQYEQLLALHADAELSLILAQLHNQLGAVLFTEDRVPAANAHFESARKLLSGDAAPHDPSFRFELARTLYLMGRSPGADLAIQEDIARPPGPRPGRPGDGRGPFPRPPEGGFRGGPPPNGPPPNGPPRRPPLGEFNDRLPPPREDLRPDGGEMGAPPPPGQREMPGRIDPRQQREHIEQAIAILTELTKDKSRPAYRQLLAQCLRELRPSPSPPGIPRDDDNLDRAIELLEELVKDYPKVPQYKLDLCETYAMHPPRPGSEGQLDDALQMMETLTRERPGIPSYSLSLAHLYLRLAQSERGPENRPRAIEYLRDAVRLQKTLAEKFTSVAPYTIAAAFYESELAKMLSEDGKSADARELLASAIDRLKPLASTEGFKPHFRLLMDICHRQLRDIQDQGPGQKPGRLPRRPPFPRSLPE